MISPLGRVDPDPDSTFEKKSDPDPTVKKTSVLDLLIRIKKDPEPTVKKKNRIRIPL